MAKIEFSNMTFTGSDLIKLLGFLGVVVSMWIDLKTDQIKDHAKREFLEYRLAQVEKCCGIKPKEIKIEAE